MAVEIAGAAHVDPVPELLHPHLALLSGTPACPSASAISARVSPTSDGLAGGT